MTFVRLWALLLLVLPLGWAAWEWRRQVRHTALILKTITFALIVFALAEPVMDMKESKVALGVLVDTSASLSDADLARETKLLKDLESERGSNQIKVIPFARGPRAFSEQEKNSGVARTAGAEGRATNLEAPVREAMASLPTGLVHRILLVTDGNENEGAVTRAAWQAQQSNIPIDTFMLAGRTQPDLKAESVGFPGTVFAGEHFPVDLTIESPKAVKATVELSAEGKSLGAHEVPLQKGSNRIRLRTSINAAGAIDLGGRIQAEGLGEARFENAVAVRRPKVDWISNDPAGTEQHIVGVLRGNQFDFNEMPALPENLDDAQFIVFNNFNLASMSGVDQRRVEDFVRRGGGALWIAGENNQYIDHKGAPEDPIERLFPAKLQPPRNTEGTCVILIVDKSSSMEGKKIELARAAASGVVENLKPNDRVGVLMFDNSFQWAVPIRMADDKATIKKLIAGIVPDGGTQIAPALAEAYHRIVPVPSTYKHIVLLTDGISEEGDSQAMSREANENKVTISTVGLGQDVNKSYLEKIAELAGGKSYFLADPQGLEQLLLRDVKEHSGTTAVERSIKVLTKHQSDLLDKVDMATAPPLLGYVRFETRPTADEVLYVDEKDPLLVQWQYGLGRTAVFASDAKTRWAQSWVTWDGFDRLWTNVFRTLLPHGSESEAVARYDAANEEIVVEYHLANGAVEPAKLPELYAIGPGDFKRPVDLARMSPGVFRARVQIGVVQGLFRIRPVEESRAFPEVGLYREESELTDHGSNEPLLRSIAKATGGRFNPPAKSAFDPGGRYIESTLRLWPWLLAAAVLLNLIELALRKWRGIFDSFRSNPSSVFSRAA